ncbi:MarR family transcriptional regulator [Actibacterium mucosum KCTC 23349]|uniref:MarR family transcriptional regulator n=1 Tax=Actibacterium mucosum KCTC 23349 TaxID=1454373 RepID=A0A037ZLV0_9RHOB|nr:MarR family winged helix-turn-helix transcriptional regulator [Actibacterium mucosum]KAJ56624.1 MarR family transcriptional regulator [Actibacterium mucosum KCTC 23349]
MIRDPLYQLIWMSRPLMQAAEAAVERGLQGSGLTVRMRAVLEILHRNGDASVPELAARLEIKRQYVQVMVNETLQAGLTERRVNPRHKSSALVSLTDTGRALIADVLDREAVLVAQIGAGIDPAEAERALNVVQALTEKLKASVKE